MRSVQCQARKQPTVCDYSGRGCGCMRATLCLTLFSLAGVPAPPDAAPAAASTSRTHHKRNTRRWAPTRR
eukprot:1351776-Rhodomonas_salina.1